MSPSLVVLCWSGLAGVPVEQLGCFVSSVHTVPACVRSLSACSPLNQPCCTPHRSMTEFDGLCSLRLREPCIYEGVKYDGVVAVQTTPVLSGKHGCHAPF